MKKLKGSDRKYLRSIAHELKPLVQVGKSGVTDGLIASLNEALDQHELVKVRFLEFKDEKKTLAVEIADRSKSEQVGMIGHIAIFYREQKDAEKRKIKLP
ncbi:MAG: ribosome assembly RNA-binding protein YhbY [Candidatus Latescibacteria bacterium]|jgi:RNA-binding protein|nr:ribosome assembly RNA-binding protein YhbY [Candidatus Latescibacterota bacterium]MBT5831247.1 ribosome assembly RNA-binding protein YhbY [Candidatus Latescibacterota bacterium]